MFVPLLEHTPISRQPERSNAFHDFATLSRFLIIFFFQWLSPFCKNVLEKEFYIHFALVAKETTKGPA
jgi:hypothetical protein